MNRVLVATNAQKILNYLIRHAGEELLAGEIQHDAGISKGGVNMALRELADRRLIRRTTKGRMYLYSVDDVRPIVKQLKVLSSIELVNSLIEKIASIAHKIILFGSCARGDDTAMSDIDLFVLTNRPHEDIEKRIRTHRLRRKLQLVVRNPVAFAKMEKREPVFWGEIARGIVLWEGKE